MYPPTVAASTPDAVSYVMSDSDDSLSFGELDAKSNALAHLLRERGVQPGDALVIFAPNSLAWPIAVAAGMRTGLAVTPLNWHLGNSELVPMLVDAHPAAVVTTVELSDTVTRALRGARPLLMLTVDGATAATEDFWSALEGLPTDPVDNELLGARVLFSGGTTGRPKAYRQPLLNIHPLDAPPRHPGLAAKLGIGPGIRFLSPAPTYHAAPFTFQLMTLAAGGTVVCMESFEASEAIRVIADQRVTHSQWVPTMLSRLVALPDRAGRNPTPDHRVAVTSGAPCPPELKDAVNDWWGDILHEYYGASEGYGHTYITPTESRTQRGSVGRPLGDAVVRVVDDAGQDLPLGEVGRVCFQGRAADGKPVLRGMGDMGRLDDEGFLYLTGRQTFMIISGGVNIYPEEIESVLAAHPAVADVAVFGMPHPDLGEQVVAVVEPCGDVDADTNLENELAMHCRTRLARYKTPRRIEFVTRLPRLPTGKLNKKALQRERAGT